MHIAANGDELKATALYRLSVVINIAATLVFSKAELYIYIYIFVSQLSTHLGNIRIRQSIRVINSPACDCNAN